MAAKREDKLAPKFRRRPSLSRRWRLLAVAAATLATYATLAVGSALAADSVYWGTEGENTISFAHLDGSGGGDLATAGATANNIIGVAIDAAAGKIYWANNSATKISYANLDGSGGGDLNTGTATVNEPFGVAIDPGAGKIYWANSGNNTISYANLNGTGGGNLSTTGATVELPTGVAIDPALGRIYWDNFHNPGGSISYANLDGSGGGNLNTGAATVEGPEGVAIEPVMGRIYWGNYHAAAISYANLNGTGGGNLSTGAATVSSPSGVAIDPVAERIYWANSTNPNGGISYANLNGTGGGNLATTGATVIDPAFPALLESPSGTGAPTITPTTTAGLRASSMQTCTRGTLGTGRSQRVLLPRPAVLLVLLAAERHRHPRCRRRDVHPDPARPLHLPGDGDEPRRLQHPDERTGSDQRPAAHHPQAHPSLGDQPSVRADRQAEAIHRQEAQAPRQARHHLLLHARPAGQRDGRNPTGAPGKSPAPDLQAERPQIAPHGALPAQEHGQGRRQQAALQRPHPRQAPGPRPLPGALHRRERSRHLASSDDQVHDRHPVAPPLERRTSASSVAVSTITKFGLAARHCCSSRDLVDNEFRR